MSILWHDYETWGINPKLDFPAQFAAVRTDLELNIISQKPINIVCQIPNDYLPNPHACLITGITPQFSQEKGYIEAEFAAKVFQHMMIPNTCVSGYNSINFDEEVTRHLFYRNFLPVYDREYQHNNSRWDIIDLVRATHALRPDGIDWVYYDDGRPCFKLEELAKANHIQHDAAHDALSDVYATIALAKLIKQKHPKLYDYFWQMRNKNNVIKSLALGSLQPLVMIAGTITAKQSCCTWILPLASHPNNKNQVLAVDLSKPLDHWITQSSDCIAEMIFSSDSNTVRPGIISIKVNKCPFIAPAKMLSPERASAIGLDREYCLDNYHQLKATPDIQSKVSQIFGFEESPYSTPALVDEMLYVRNFPSSVDKALMEKIRNSQPDALTGFYSSFEDDLFNQQLFLYQGRNYPHTFSDSLRIKWQQHRMIRFESGTGCISLNNFRTELIDLFQHLSNQPRKLGILKSLDAYVSSL